MSKITDIKEVVDLIIPPDDEKKVYQWRRRMAAIIGILLIVMIGVLVVMIGALQRMGGPAMATEESVTAQLTPVLTKLVNIDVRTVDILRQLYRPQMRSKVRERCDTKDQAVRERINFEIDLLQKAFKKAAGESVDPLVEPTCDKV